MNAPHDDRAREWAVAFRRFCVAQASAPATVADAGTEFVVIKVHADEQGTIVLLANARKRIALHLGRPMWAPPVGTRCCLRRGLHLCRPLDR